MWVLIEATLATRGVEIDRAGLSGRVFETYPRAALAAWGHRERGKTELATLEEHFPFLRVDAQGRRALDNDHACDALVCALVALARGLGRTLGPPEGDLAAARREGWIHVSVQPSRGLTHATGST